MRVQRREKKKEREIDHRERTHTHSPRVIFPASPSGPSSHYRRTIIIIIYIQYYIMCVTAVANVYNIYIYGHHYTLYNIQVPIQLLFHCWSTSRCALEGVSEREKKYKENNIMSKL